MRMIDCLRERGLSSKDARRVLETGKVKIGGVPTSDAGREIDPDDVVYNPQFPRITVGRDLAIVYSDDELAVVWKPARMLTVAAAGRQGESNLLAECARILGSVRPVHRLDEGTSGLMLVARTDETRHALIEMLSVHAIHRGYLAITSGTFPERPKEMRTNMVRDRGDGKRGSIPGRRDGVDAITNFKLVQVLRNNASVVEARLETGRTHQVRVHLAEAGYPVLGDRLYAKSREAQRAPRLALHAWRLGFDHPTTGRSHRFEAVLADDLEILRRELDTPKKKGQSKRRPSKPKPRKR